MVRLPNGEILQPFTFLLSCDGHDKVRTHCTRPFDLDQTIRILAAGSRGTVRSRRLRRAIFKYATAPAEAARVT
jgi:hypothetical protein